MRIFTARLQKNEDRTCRNIRIQADDKDIIAVHTHDAGHIGL